MEFAKIAEEQFVEGKREWKLPMLLWRENEEL